MLLRSHLTRPCSGMRRRVISEPEPVSALQLNIQPGRSPLTWIWPLRNPGNSAYDVMQSNRYKRHRSSYSERKCEHSLASGNEMRTARRFCQFRDLDLPICLLSYEDVGLCGLWTIHGQPRGDRILPCGGGLSLSFALIPRRPQPLGPLFQHLKLMAGVGI